MPEHHPEDVPFPSLEENGSPLHGYRGHLEADAPLGVPAGLTVAISRETGSRGAAIAKRAGEKLGWEVYNQDLMDFLVQDTTVRQEMQEKLPAQADTWIEKELNRLTQQERLSRLPSLLDLARMVLALAAQGNVILLGRGAGHLLPHRSTLHVRLIAPLEDRIAYISQWLRLTEEEAADHVRSRDQRRSEFISTHFLRKPNDPHAYDMVLNTRLLGEERCADLIAAAAKAKMSAIMGMD